MATVVACGLAIPATAAADPPSNDDFTAATTISALPYSSQTNTSEATHAVDDPSFCEYSAVRGTVWFDYTPSADVLLRATTSGSDHGTVLTAVTGNRGALEAVPNACDSASTSDGATITFPAKAGTTYHFMIGGYYVLGGALSFGVREVAPAANDAFADAEPISELPATRDADLSTATTEYDEPSQSCVGGAGRTVWYSYTPAATTSLTASVTGPYESSVSVYTGATLPELREIDCAGAQSSDRVLFRATAGTTYYLRLTGTAWVDNARLTLAEAAPLQPQFGVSPSDPTVYELVYFSGYSGEFDAPIATSEWDFGDGTVIQAGAETVSHHYLADGVYPVRFSLVTTDGRTGSTTREVTVSTHDVSIERFVTPARARAGETADITVRVAGSRYRESVTTELYRSNGQFWELVGTTTLDVPAGRTVRFPFAYTFTDADAVVGKVNFRAVARLPYDVRDARPLDNEQISSGTTVSEGDAR